MRRKNDFYGETFMLTLDREIGRSKADGKQAKIEGVSISRYRFLLFFALVMVAFTAVVLSRTAKADIADGTPFFTVTLPTMDKGCTTCVPPAPPLPIPPWGSVGDNAFRFVEIFCDGSSYHKIEAPTSVAQPPATQITYQALPGEFDAGTHICHAIVELYSENQSQASNNVNFIIARPIYDPEPPVLEIR